MSDSFGPAVGLLSRNDAGESVHRFGDGLVGVLNRPASGTAHPVALILFNAGLVHRTGPYQVYSRLAQALAQEGFAVLRFDQSGFGDSDVSRSSAKDLRHIEMRAAMDLLQVETGASEFVLGGLCSGADHVFYLAPDQPRVAGLMMIDGWVYPTTGFWVRYLLPRIFNPIKLLRWLKGRKAAAAKASNVQYMRDYPTRDEARLRVKAMVERGWPLLFVLTGGIAGYFNHAGQLAASMGAAIRSPQVRAEYWADCDHTFYLRRDRERLQSTVVAWMKTQFGARPRA